MFSKNEFYEELEMHIVASPITVTVNQLFGVFIRDAKFAGYHMKSESILFIFIIMISWTKNQDKVSYAYSFHATKERKKKNKKRMQPQLMLMEMDYISTHKMIHTHTQFGYVPLPV